jgi:arginine:pyruvate transaminase
MKLSNRILNLEGGGVDGWAVHYRATEMRRAGVKVISLCVGEPDRGVSVEIADAMDASVRAGNTGYSEVKGIPDLRAALARREDVGLDEVMVTSGGQAALFAALSACTDHGDVVVTLDPQYVTYNASIRAVGGIVKQCTLSPESGFQPDFETLDTACKNARVLMINSPNNPTGAVYDAKAMDAVARVAIKHDLWVISDEVYSDLIFEGDHISPRSLDGMKERTFVIGSFSKTYSMTGFRIGWLLAPASAITPLQQLGNATTYGTPAFIQEAALVALNAVDTDHARDLYRARRDAVMDALSAYTLVPSAGGMYVMLDVRSTGMTGLDFAMALLESEGIAVMPGESFGVGAAGHVRIALTVEVEEIKEACMKIAQFLGSKS